MVTMSKAISNLNLLTIFDEIENKTYYGCDQEWFASKWQCLSGCGPTVATNIIIYLNNIAFKSEQKYNNKKDCVLLMGEIWKYVTPSFQGVNSTKMFYDSMLIYTKLKGLNVEYDYCDLPKNKTRRPKLSEVLDFLEKAFNKDVPIAFLNLSNGDEKNLDQWHWVTVISLEYSEDKNIAVVNILDEGQVKKIDLALWYNTTTRGGGFVYFTASV